MRRPKRTEQEKGNQRQWRKYTCQNIPSTEKVRSEWNAVLLWCISGQDMLDGIRERAVTKFLSGLQEARAGERMANCWSLFPAGHRSDARVAGIRRWPRAGDVRGTQATHLHSHTFQHIPTPTA